MNDNKRGLGTVAIVGLIVISIIGFFSGRHADARYTYAGGAVQLAGGANIVGDGAGGLIFRNDAGVSVATLSSAGVFKIADLETGTISASDGALAMTLTDSTGATTTSTTLTVVDVDLKSNGSAGIQLASGATTLLTIDSSGNFVATGSGRVARLGVGGAAGAYNGTVKLAPDWTTGDIKAIEFATPGAYADYSLYLSADNNIRGNGHARWLNLVASGALQGDTVKNTAGTGAPTFTYGLATAPGSGILVGGAAANVPTTNAVDIYTLGALVSYPGGTTEIARIQNNNGRIRIARGSVSVCDMSMGTLYPAGVRSPSYSDADGNLLASDIGTTFALAAGTSCAGAFSATKVSATTGEFDMLDLAQTDTTPGAPSVGDDRLYVTEVGRLSVVHSDTTTDGYKHIDE